MQYFVPYLPHETTFCLWRSRLNVKNKIVANRKSSKIHIHVITNFSFNLFMYLLSNSYVMCMFIL